MQQQHRRLRQTPRHMQTQQQIQDMQAQEQMHRLIRRRKTQSSLQPKKKFSLRGLNTKANKHKKL